ncbi:hypothetical protein D3C76_1412320 [compost metagenome]
MPVLFVTEEEGGIVEVHFAGHVCQRLHAETRKVAIRVAAITVHADQYATVDIPLFFVTGLPVLVVAAFQRRQLAAAAGAVQVEFDVAVQLEIG